MRFPILPDSPSPTDGQTLVYDDVSKRWVPATASGGGGGTSDHAALTNRDAADQHPIGAVTGLQSALDGKAEVVHDHDDRYYTEGEVDGALADKADTSHTHDATDLTGVVKTVNGTAPDSAGDVAVEGGGGDLVSYASQTLLPGQILSLSNRNQAVTADSRWVSVFRTPGMPLRSIQISVQTAATEPGATGRIALYAWDESARAGVLVADYGSVALDSTGKKIATAPAGDPLPAGAYGMAFVASHDCTLVMLPVAGLPYGVQQGQWDNAQGRGNPGWVDAMTYSTPWPENFTASGIYHHVGYGSALTWGILL